MTTDLSSTNAGLGGLAAGLVTSVVENASPGLPEKIAAVMQHSISTFTTHNPGLAPVAESALAYLEGLANEHGAGIVSGIVNGLIGIFEAAPSNVTVATAPVAPAG